MEEYDSKQTVDLPEVGGNIEECEEEMEGSDCSSSCKSCSDLQKRLAEEQKRCTVLRSNIHKVSANWFNRKYKISESDMDGDSSSSNAETTQTDDTKTKEVEGETMAPSGLSKDMSKLVSIIAQKSAQLDLSETHCRDLKRKMREYESMIDDKENIIHGLKDQLESYLNDNQKLSNQLKNLTSLFLQLEKAEKESVSPTAADAEATDSGEGVSAPPLPSPKEYEEMASSVSRTYIKLKDLIYEKRSLVTEIERLNTLNVELQRRVMAQENRLVNVTDALHQTWLVVSDLKDQHAKLHEDELVFKYELQEKREILTKLRKELEMSRQKWEIIRQKNLESELEYASLREMLKERRMESKESEKAPEEEKEPDEAVCLHPEDATFDPPVDLLLEMGLEYGIIGENAEMTETVLNVIKGEDIRTNRLEHLEEHCSLLYTKLIASTSKSLSLASRLTRLHSQYGEEDEEYEDDNQEYGHGEEISDNSDTDDDETPYITDANHLAIIESVLSSPASEEYDTAYVSETDADPNALDNIAVLDLLDTVNESITPQESEENTSEDKNEDIELEENCDHLSKTLINFLPRKIEILRQQNSTLENRISDMEAERNASNDKFRKAVKEKQKLEEEIKILTKEMTFEKLQKRQVEEQLKHLGKCVDELKLKHDAERKGIGKLREEDEEESGDEGTAEERTEDERKREDDKMKREVELLKREMEIKKKEKELKKRETEIMRRDKNKEEVKSEELEQVSTNAQMNGLISSIVSAVNESRHCIENDGGATASNHSGHQFTIVEGVASEEILSNISNKGVVVYPVRLRAEEEATCRVTPSQNVSLFVLQLQSTSEKETSENTPSTSKESPDGGSDASILVPSTLLPSHSSSSITLSAKSHVMCVVALRQMQCEEFEVKLQMTRNRKDEQL